MASTPSTSRRIRTSFKVAGNISIAENQTEALIPLTANGGAEINKWKIVVLGRAGTASGSVILLHSTHSQTVEALPQIISKLRERGYPPRLYVPREDVSLDRLTRSDTVTHCPFKGDAAYFSFGDQADVAWSYERPLEGMETIAEYLAFDDDKALVTENR